MLFDVLNNLCPEPRGWRVAQEYEQHEAARLPVEGAGVVSGGPHRAAWPLIFSSSSFPVFIAEIVERGSEPDKNMIYFPYWLNLSIERL
ncbi:hypothetical protein [Methylocapsa palsarum]|uniref:hypothetical protein n=1 Tax=Methylocapsa palsarum TaxID=1612308 RepID=UPI0011143532|nr:hypothetical protein [Methylocapsa palsarum]